MDRDFKTFMLIVLIGTIIALYLAYVIVQYEVDYINGIKKFCKFMGNGTHIIDNIKINCTKWNIGEINLII